MKTLTRIEDIRSAFAERSGQPVADIFLEPGIEFGTARIIFIDGTRMSFIISMYVGIEIANANGKGGWE
jgi:hypothetical protein